MLMHLLLKTQPASCVSSTHACPSGWRSPKLHRGLNGLPFCAAQSKRSDSIPKKGQTVVFQENMMQVACASSFDLKLF